MFFCELSERPSGNSETLSVNFLIGKMELMTPVLSALHGFVGLNMITDVEDALQPGSARTRSCFEVFTGTALLSLLPFAAARGTQMQLT